MLIVLEFMTVLGEMALDAIPSSRVMADLPRLERPLSACSSGGGTPQTTVLSPPLRPMPVISSAFGPRWGRWHAGVDLPVPVGTPIHAVADGAVVRASHNPSFGNVVVLRLTGPGRLAGDHLLYAHLHTFRVVAGQTVRRGDRLGATGNTGRSTGPHLHFSHLVGLPAGSVRRDGPMGFWEREYAVDPMPLLDCASAAGQARRPTGDPPVSFIAAVPLPDIFDAAEIHRPQ